MSMQERARACLPRMLIPVPALEQWQSLSEARGAKCTGSPLTTEDMTIKAITTGNDDRDRDSKLNAW